jgi:hypothetical protein
MTGLGIVLREMCDVRFVKCNIRRETTRAKYVMHEEDSYHARSCGEIRV